MTLACLHQHKALPPLRFSGQPGRVHWCFFADLGVFFLAVRRADQGKLPEGLETPVHPYSLLPLLRGPQALPTQVPDGHQLQSEHTLPRSQGVYVSCSNLKLEYLAFAGC